jgi:excisionase family DNA binding protein
MDKFYTTKQIASALGVRTISVRRWIEKGRLQAVRLDKEFRILEKDFNKFISDRKTRRKK